MLDPVLIVEKEFGLKASKFLKLVGELDQNFKIYLEDGSKYILKIAHPTHGLQHLKMENEAMLLAAKNQLNIETPKLIKNKKGHYISQVNNQNIRLLTWVDGRLWSEVNPHSKNLLFELGKSLGEFHNSIAVYENDILQRTFKWNPSEFQWVIDESETLFQEKEKSILINKVNHIYSTYFNKVKDDLPKSCCYLDANDNNIIVTSFDENTHDPTIKGFIDFGDLIYTQRINELAVALAYACMHKNDPIEAAIPVIRGFNQIVPLQDNEVAALFPAILARLAISVSFSAKRKAEIVDNPYLQISENAAWKLMSQLLKIHPRFAICCFRFACDKEPDPNSDKVRHWLKENINNVHSILSPHVSKEKISVFNWSIGSTSLGNVDQFHEVEKSTFSVFKNMQGAGAEIGIGRYDEPRPVYSTSHYIRSANDGYEWRTVHIGMDIFMPAGESLFAPFDGVVISSHDDELEKSYGPLLILKHTPTVDITFYTLYGHNDPEHVQKLKVGDEVKKGDRIAFIGNFPENGNWVPHLHFQIMTDLFGFENDFPGVAFPSLREVWKSISPDPNLIFQFSHPDLLFERPEISSLLNRREQFLGKNLSTSYTQPLQIMRGYMQYLFDENGRKYLDTVNNVPHVGHQHPRIVQASQLQSAVLNTNTRYLHPKILDYSERLLEKLPDHLDVLYFLNSGSEANELALRLAKNFTSRKGIVALQHGYHGNTEQLIGISDYKCNGKGGHGLSHNAALMPVPDPLRDAEKTNYAHQLQEVIDTLTNKGFSPGVLIHETILSCGGQLVLPEAFFKSIYEVGKRNGLVMIADEVQTGFGRVGDHFWAFEQNHVAPDIVVMGKPIGNGHPMAALAVRREIAEAFHNGMEFFSTFAGNPVSCVIGLEVLKVIEEEKLQENAKRVGDFLISKLNNLKTKYPVIADVRGQGLFLGIELVSDIDSFAHSEKHATYLINRMRTKGILMSSDGPKHNVIKIKPPICFSKHDAVFLLEMLEEVLREDFMKVS